MFCKRRLEWAEVSRLQCPFLQVLESPAWMVKDTIDSILCTARPQQGGVVEYILSLIESYIMY